MAKKSIGQNRKEILRQIETNLNEGISKQQILEELSEEYFDQSTIAKLIASTTDGKTKAKYKWLNNILLVLLVATIVAKIILGIKLLSVTSFYALPLVLLFPLINIWFAIEVSKYKGYVYKILAFFTVAGMLQMIGKFQGETVWLLIDLVMGASIAGISFYLGNEMFPNLGFWGVKKDETF